MALEAAAVLNLLDASSYYVSRASHASHDAGNGRHSITGKFPQKLVATTLQTLLEPVLACFWLVSLQRFAKCLSV